MTDARQQEAELEQHIKRAPKLHVPDVADLLRALGYRASLVEFDTACLYRREAEDVGSIRLVPYSGGRLDSAMPLIWRWHVDHYMVKFPARAYAELGLECPRPRWRPAYWTRREDGRRKLELSCLPSELADIAAWLPTWIDARDRGVPHPECPVQMSREGEVLDYAWTEHGRREIDVAQQARKQRELAREQRRQARERQQETP
jgi:hypothetical protein